MRHTIRLTDHAVERYQLRVRPALTIAQVREDLERLMAFGKFVEKPPAWVVPDDDRADGYLILAPGVCLAVVQERHCRVAVTCLTNMGLSDETRRKRNLDARAKRYRRGIRRRKWAERKQAKRLAA